MYRELGGEIITLGTDAHSPAHVGCAIRERQASAARAAGLPGSAPLKSSMPVWHEL